MERELFKHFCAKTQSRCNIYGGLEKGEMHTTRWIAFSLTNDDIEELKEESHLYGKIFESTEYCSLDENDLCMHP